MDFLCVQFQFTTKQGYFLYSDQEFDALSENFSEVVQVVKEDL